MASETDAVLRQQAPEIDEVGADQQGIFGHRQRFTAIDAVNRLIDAKNEVIGISLGNALRAPADAAAGIEDQRRLAIPRVAGSQRCGEGGAVVVEDGLPERMRDVATNQLVEVAVRTFLRTDDQARVAAHAASGSSPRMPAAISAASMSFAALIGRRRW